MTKLDSLQIAFYMDNLCHKADDALRIAFVLTLHADAAKKCLVNAYEKMANSLGEIKDKDSMAPIIGNYIWQSFSELKSRLSFNGDASQDKSLNLLSKLSFEQRASVAFIDCLGLGILAASEIMKKTESDFYLLLGQGRQIWLDIKKGSCDNEFFYAHLSEYIDGELTAENNVVFEKIISEQGYLDLIEQFRQAKGDLQIKLQSIQLSSREMAALREIVQPREIGESLENNDIDTVERIGFVSRVVRTFIFIAIFVGIGWGGYLYFAPPPKAKFNSLEALTYEALVLDEDSSGGRLTFPSDNLDEILKFFTDSKRLDFAPSVLVAAERLGWKPVGATIIDYDVAKIATTQFRNNENDHLFHFVFNEELKVLPQAEQVTDGQLVYQAYASTELNLIAWQYPNEGPLGFLVGRLSAPELAKIVKESIPRK